MSESTEKCDVDLSEKGLAAIERRAAKATPGEWAVDASYRRPELKVFACDLSPQPAICKFGITPEESANADFIAAARTDVPALVTEVRRLRERETRLTHERNALGRAIADAAHIAGIYNGEVALTGPDLILLAQNMAEEIERSSALRTRDARIPSLDQLDALLTKYRAQSHCEPIDLLGAIQTAEARAEAAREHPDPNARRFLLLDCAAWALAAVCEIDGAQASAPIAVTREANDEGSGP